MSSEFSALPTLTENYQVTIEQINDFQKNGHIFLPQVCNQDEVMVYRPVIANIVEELNYHTKPVYERETYGKAFIKIHNLWQKSEAARRFVLAKRFANIAADLMGVDGVRLFIDQALFKEPGGGHTPWHQDQVYWPLDSDKTITMWMPLVPIPANVGTMTFASESHAQGYISKVVISDESHRTLKQYIEHKGFAQVNYGAMMPGDATFHAGWTLHSAPDNPTDTMREVMTVIYFADGTKIAEPDSNARRAVLEDFFPELQPGDVIDLPQNPIVFSRKG